MTTMIDGPKRILVVDDEQTICSAFEAFFSRRGWQVVTASSLGATQIHLAKDSFDVLFLDVRLPDGHGLEWFEQQPDGTLPPTIVMTAFGDMETVTRSMAGAAFDYLPKPVDLDKALSLAQRAGAAVFDGDDSTPTAPPVATSDDEGPVMIGSAAAMQEVYKQIAIFARTDSSVLILGETGTGKDLAAQRIHSLGPRAEGPMVAVNCGSLPESLVESELFGYERGAFTGAEATRHGRFESADGGTLFLDEVGELPLAAQVKLLRVLDTRTIERVGSVKPIPVDVRVIAATNRDLQTEVREGRFREDLYYRLAVLQMTLPPLRQRRDDILPLARFFFETLGSPATLSSDAQTVLTDYPWPGNVRELHNAIQHAAAIAAGGMIYPDDLPQSLTQPSRAAGGEPPASLAAQYVASLAEGKDLFDRATVPVEKEVIQRALMACGGNQSKAAQLLGLHRNTLRKKIESFQIYYS
jgi:two-component system response regulator AtoC